MAQPIQYTVRGGDSISSILRKLGLPNWNNPTGWGTVSGYGSGNWNLIRPGEVLSIQDPRQPAAPAPAPAPTPAPAPAPVVQPRAPIAQTVTQPFVEQGNLAAKQPVFSEVLPFYESWERLSPAARLAAEAQVAPEINRQRSQALRDYQMGLAGSGGGRFGRAVGGTGSIGAQYQRSQGEQIEDWMKGYRGGYENLFYNPAQQAWNTAITQGKTPEMPDVPTWQEFESMYNKDQGVSSPYLKSESRSF